MTTYLERARCGIWDVRASFLPENYIQSVTRAGGMVVLLPPQPANQAAIEEVLNRIDGLIIAGGRDVDPRLYGQKSHETTDNPAEDRDAWEIALLQSALSNGVPYLGVCRGAQVLNVALGGTLHQHVPDVVGHTGHQVAKATFNTNTVNTEPGSKTEQIMGSSCEVRCYHHQAIDQVGEGLTVTGRDADGMIEAIEVQPEGSTDPWAIGVQWHPEQNLDDLRIFEGHVKAAAEFKAKRLALH